MPDTPPPAAQPEPSSEPIEFNFDKPASEIPRIKRRSLKGKNPGLKPASTPPTARDLEREAPPLAVDEAAKPVPAAPDARETSQGRTEPARTTPSAPPRTTPVVSKNTASPVAGVATQRPVATAASSQKPAGASGISPNATGQKVNIALTAQQKATVSSPAAGASTSPHGTRPATLYYTSQPKKEASVSMKTTPTASPAATPSSSSSASAASSARPAGAASAASTATRPAVAGINSAAPTRPAATNFDYRANVERQSREQKSVGSILAYFVYGLIAVFLFGAGLATYGSVVIFDKLHDQSTSISSLDDKYAQKVTELNKQLAATEDGLAQSQAQNARQLDLLNRQEEEINQLRVALTAASSASAEAIHAEARTRAQEDASLRARVRDLEYKTSIQNSATRP